MLQGYRQVADGWEQACQLTQLTLSQLRKHYICCGGKSLLKQFPSVSSDREIKGETARELTRRILSWFAHLATSRGPGNCLFPFSHSLASRMNYKEAKPTTLQSWETAQAAL